MSLKEFAYLPSARLPLWQRHTVFDSAGDYRYFVLPHQNLAKFSRDTEGSGLRNNESFTIQAAEDCLLVHIFVYIKQPDGEACFLLWVTITSNQALGQPVSLGLPREGCPSDRIRVKVGRRRWIAVFEIVIPRGEFLVDVGDLDSIHVCI